MKNLVKVKEVPFSWRKSLASLSWIVVVAVAGKVIPQMIADLSQLQPEKMYYGWLAMAAIVALKVIWDMITHRTPKK